MIPLPGLPGHAPVDRELCPLSNPFKKTTPVFFELVGKNMLGTYNERVKGKSKLVMMRSSVETSKGHLPR